MERYLAVSKPIEYHNAVSNSSKWPRILAYVLTVIFFSVIINVPKFFELTVARKNISSDPVSYHKNQNELRLGMELWLRAQDQNLADGI